MSEATYVLLLFIGGRLKVMRLAHGGQDGSWMKMPLSMLLQRRSWRAEMVAEG